MSTEELTGVQKAAILLIALGPEKSADIFKHLKEEEIEELLESGKIDELNAHPSKIGVAEYRQDLVDEYIYFLRKNFEEKITKILKQLAELMFCMIQ